MTTATVLLFLSASVALTVAPGPDNLFVIAVGISRGRRAAVFTALGMCSGITVHTTAAALGISALFYSSPWAFHGVKYAGAAYLLLLAVRALRESGTMLRQQAPLPVSEWARFRRGFLMNVLNPKVALFFLAFLPQFVVREAGYVALQMLLLGAIFLLQAVLIFPMIGFFSGTLGNRVLKQPQIGRWLNRLAAAVFVALALRLALVSR